MKKLTILIVLAALWHTVSYADEPDYSFRDIRASISEAEKSEIQKTIAACADIMTFDIKAYDYDRLFKYILYTHDNFRILTDIDPDTQLSDFSGQQDISLVSSEFIDYVMENVFRITPEKPPASALTERGFCLSNGYYLYRGGFGVYFSTEIDDISHVYDLGHEVLLITFTDTYSEGDTKTKEDSFAILQKTDTGYALLRLGMGENAPTESQALGYVPNTIPEGNDVGDTKPMRTHESFLVPLLLFIIAGGITGIALCAAALKRTRK